MAIVTAHVEAVQKLYVAYFNRPADHAGLDFWTNIVANQNGSTAMVSAAFAAEAEYKTEYANMSNADIVNKVYLNLFGRPAETAGKEFWAKALDNKTLTIDKVVAEIAKGALTTDAEAYENKVSGATAFTAQLDTTAEQNGYRGADANAQAKAFITSITNDASLTAAVAPVALATTVSKVVVAGTPFTVAGALSSLDAAKAAKTSFLVTADGDTKADTTATDASLNTGVTTAVTKVQGLLKDDVEATYASGSAAVKAALIADQQAANAKALVDAQAVQTTANANVAKVAGLQSAISTAAAAKTAETAAVTAQKAAAADLAAKLAFYNATNSKSLTVETTGAVAGLIEVNADNKLVLASGVTEAKNPGVTALLASSTAQEAAEVNAAKAAAAAVATQNTVDYIDTSDAEQAELVAIKAMFKDVVITGTAMPTEAQIAEQLAIFKAKDAAAGNTVYEDFQAAVTAFYDQTAAENTLTKALADSAAGVKTANDNIKAFNDALTALSKAEALVVQRDALDATIATATKVFADRGYTVNNIDAAIEFGSDKADIFMADKAFIKAGADASIELFNLQGVDSLFIGSDFTLNRGALTTGNDAVLEAFVRQVGSNTEISLETSAFGSSAAVAEVVTITLVGVDATTIQLNNGIITSVAPTA